MTAKLDLIALGVSDIERARQFYEHGFGCRVEADGAEFVKVRLGPKASALALRPWDALAGDAGVSAVGNGFRGFTLSYIVDCADAVDQVLARAIRAGGAVSKPPRSALWGYSAYVTDPSGHLWKIASPKRRPPLGRKRQPACAQPVEVPITIGVADIKRAKAFYQEALGLAVKQDYRKFVSFRGDGGSDLALYTWDALAADAAVPAVGSGFRGFSLHHRAESPAHVGALLERASRAGGTVIRPAAATQDEYGGCFADPDANLWHVSARTPTLASTNQEGTLDHARA